MKMKALTILVILPLLLLPLASASAISFQVSSPKITDKYVDYDISMVSATQNSTMIEVKMVVYGMINLVPQKGYIKEYDVNITANRGYYVHCFMVTNNGSKPISYVMIQRKPHIVNYTINTSTLIWLVPSSYFENITGNYTVNAYAGIASISQQKFIFLDHVRYPPLPSPPEEESQPYEYYLLTGATVFALGIVIYLEFKRLKNKK